MTPDFAAGSDWIIGLSRIFTISELRLIWALKKADGFLTEKQLGKALTGRDHIGSKVVHVTISRLRKRALGMGMQIVCERGKGWRIVEMQTIPRKQCGSPA